MQEAESVGISSRISDYFERNKMVAVALIASLAVFFAAVDLLTPKEIHLEVFYGIPVALCAWVFASGWAYLAAVFCAVLTVTIFSHQGGHYVSAMEVSWDLVSAFAAYSLLIGITRRFRQTYDSERQARLSEHQFRIAAEEAGSLKTDLMRLLGHELGNATLIISSSVTELSEGEGVEDPSARDLYLRAIRRAADSLSEASHNFLNSTALESGRVTTRTESIHIRTLFGELNARFQPVIAEKGLRLEFDAAEETPSVSADAAALRLILVNLIGNAVKYTPRGGRISVRTDKMPSGLIRFSVIDTGIGIAAEDLGKIQGSFFRSERGRDMAKGYGLGLAIVDGLLKAQNSQLLVSSELGKGSTFSFDLPAIVPRPASSATTKSRLIRS